MVTLTFLGLPSTGDGGGGGGDGRLADGPRSNGSSVKLARGTLFSSFLLILMRVTLYCGPLAGTNLIYHDSTADIEV